MFTGVPVWILINKFHLTPKQLVANLICMFRKGGGLGTNKTYSEVPNNCMYTIIIMIISFGDFPLYYYMSFIRVFQPVAVLKKK